jgi:hypothetical protein
MEGLKKILIKLSQDSRFLGRKFKSGPPENEAGMLTTQPSRLVSKYKLSWKKLFPYKFRRFGDAIWL